MLLLTCAWAASVDLLLSSGPYVGRLTILESLRVD